MNASKESAVAEVRERAFSTSLTTDVGMRVKMIAHRENRSFANVIESAVKVFTLFPKDVRDILVDAAADADTGRKRLKELSRSVMYQDAMRRLDEAANASVMHMSVEPDSQDYDDAVVVGRRP
jgi:ABC-type phosphate transport system ATPase subunit